ncbi:MAG: VCBS repeat-containing protein [Planctomycetes bacterium]|nr:VCBS repeat-containing protein [Planctomycetota bacterium]
MRELPLIVSVLCASAASLRGQEAPGLALSVRGGFETELAVCGARCVELDGRPGDELLVLAEDGAVRTWSVDPATHVFAPEPRGTLVLPDPSHALVATARLLDGDARPALVVADASGVHAWRPLEGGGFGGEPIELLPRYRQRVRVGAPAFAPIAQDVDGDGRDDLVLPNGAELELWMRAGPSNGATSAAHFTKAASVHVEVRHARASSADELSDVLSASLAIPDLFLTDVNGDGRADLVVAEGDRRAYHLVRAGGSIPAAPDVVLDLSIFKDTTPEAVVAPGRTLAGGDATRLETRDLDLDGIPDHVIAHRRKVWVFPGTKDGPQFEKPSAILKAADDVTALALVRLDDDERADLLLFKLQVPSIGAILQGLLREWSVEVECAGYRNKDGRSFATTPEWKSTIEVRLPAILDIARDPNAIVERFEAAGKKFRAPALADLDGDGRQDVALLTEDKTAIEAWRGGAGAVGVGREDEALLKELLFDDREKTWDLERVLAFLGDYAAQRVARVTGGRAAEARFALRDPAKARLLETRACDVDGDGRGELLLEYWLLDSPGRRRFDVLGAR